MSKRREQRSQYFNACGHHTMFANKWLASEFLMVRRVNEPEFLWKVRPCRWTPAMKWAKKGAEHFHVRKVGARTPEQVAEVLARRAVKAAQIATQGFFTTRGRSHGANGRRRGRKELRPYGTRQQPTDASSTGHVDAEGDCTDGRRQRQKGTPAGAD